MIINSTECDHMKRMHGFVAPQGETLLATLSATKTMAILIVSCV